jgi:hypothetical protein
VCISLLVACGSVLVRVGYIACVRVLPLESVRVCVPVFVSGCMHVGAATYIVGHVSVRDSASPESVCVCLHECCCETFVSTFVFVSTRASGSELMRVFVV